VTANTGVCSMFYSSVSAFEFIFILSCNLSGFTVYSDVVVAVLLKQKLNLDSTL
jgi:hypothetical protein